MGVCQICGKHADLFKKLWFAMVKDIRKTFRVNKIYSIIEAVNLVCVDILEDHVLVSEFCLALQETKVLEALTHDIDVPCIVQWRMLWYSAPTSLDNALLNDGVILETFNESMNWAFQSAFVLPHWRMNTP